MATQDQPQPLPWSGGRHGTNALGQYGFHVVPAQQFIHARMARRVPIGGGALSGKDFFKVDRAGALHARRLAKAVVMTGVASEALVRLSWFPGDASARLVSIQGEEGSWIEPGPWQGLFDLSLGASGECWTNAVDLISVARCGHFTETHMPWEEIMFSNSWGTSLKCL